jgi:hypothetical protein
MAGQSGQIKLHFTPVTPVPAGSAKINFELPCSATLKASAATSFQVSFVFG